jgi:hypothetical protein
VLRPTWVSVFFLVLKSNIIFEDFLDNHQRFDSFFDHQPSDLGITQSSRVDDFLPSFQRTIPERQRSPYRFQGNTSASNNNNNDYFPLNSSKPLHGTTSTSTVDSPNTQHKQYTNNNPIAAKEIPVNIIPPTYHQPNSNLTTTPLTELRRFPTRTSKSNTRPIATLLTYLMKNIQIPFCFRPGHEQSEST